MKVLTKGMLLISVPLLLQLIVVTTLAIMLWHANSQALYESNAKEIVAACNDLLQHISGVVKQNFMPDGGNSFTDQVGVLQNDVEVIRQQLSADKRQSAETRALDEKVSEFIPLLKRLQQPQFLYARGADRPERVLFLEIDKFYDKVWAIIASVESTNMNDPVEREKTANWIKDVLIGFIALSVLVSAGLTYFASISLRRPIKRMVLNAVAIAKREKLAPRLDGQDELADLDNLLHDVDESIEVALTSERSMVANAADLICSVDANGLFRSVNPHAYALLGYSPEFLVGSSLLDFVVSEDCDKVDRLLSIKSPTGEPTNIEVQMRKQDRDVVDTIWSVVWSEKDQSFFCVMHDITERKNIERLKQDFLAMISHDLRTPLMSVHSTFELVSMGATGELDQTTQTQLMSAMRSTEHLIELVNDLLDFEKLQAGRMNFDVARVATSEIIDESLQLVKALSDEMRVRIESPKNSEVLRGDLRKLIQVLVNLLSNALKHSPTNGRIMITVDRVDSQVLLQVHDEGPGVPEEYRSSIFAPFEQISHRSTAKLGTGLGLAICRLIVEGLGGSIGVTSSSKLSGSCFYISLPR